jgi:hypothetical protein
MQVQASIWGLGIGGWGLGAGGWCALRTYAKNEIVVFAEAKVPEL